MSSIGDEVSAEDIANIRRVLPGSDAEKKLEEIFFPYAQRRIAAALKRNAKFVYYTTAETAAKIIVNKEIWMRRATCMNDISEVAHGLNCLRFAYRHDASGKHFKDLVESLAPGLTKEIEVTFDSWSPWFFEDTYLVCLSAHDEAKEGKIGRLSMWRAYGAGAGVALVINPAPFYSTSRAFGATTSPVAYEDENSFRALFDKLTFGMAAQIEFLRTLSRQELHANIFNAFRFAALCTKHPGFREEDEWRIVYSPKIMASPYIRTDIETISGVPQRVHKIALKDVPEIGQIGAEIPDLLDHLIVGPSQYAAATRDAFVELLTRAGMSDAPGRVVVSGMPLRPM